MYLWSFLSEDMTLYYRGTLFFQKITANFHFCTCLLIQISCGGIRDLSLTRKTVFHSMGGRKRLKNFFSFPSIAEIALWKVLPSLVQNGSTIELHSSGKHRSQPRSV